MLSKSALSRVSCNSVKQECPANLSSKSVKQECQERVSSESVKQECQQRVSSKCLARVSCQECPARVSKSVQQECPFRSVPHGCQARAFSQFHVDTEQCGIANIRWLEVSAAGVARVER